MELYPVGDVFGLSRDLPLNYVTRERIDGELIDSITRGKHIIIHGSSKQGKTSLRKHCLEEEDYIVVTCQSKWNISDLNASVLKEAGFEIKRLTEKAQSGNFKVQAKVKAGFSLFGMGKAEAELGSERGQGEGRREVFEPLELDPNDVNDIIRALTKVQFKKFIILEDFHYLPVDTQKEFSFALKAYHENSSLCFIIVGVWKESNRLTRYNGDLTNRVISIDADLWQSEELNSVISDGEKLLNITFSDKFRETLVKSCFDSVYIVQEACYQACKAANINTTVKNMTAVPDKITATEVIKRVVEEQSGRFDQALSIFERGFQETKLDMYKWLLFVMLTEDAYALEKGIRLSTFNKKISKYHPKGKDVQAASVTNALSNIGSLQAKRELRPIIFDYDEQILHTVDRSFLIWISVQSRTRLLKLIDLPDYVIEKFGEVS